MAGTEKEASKVSETLTEAEKAQMLADANPPAEDVANLPTPRAFGEDNQPQNTQRLGPDLAAAIAQPVVDVSKPMTPQSGGPGSALTDWEWGPYDDYNIVNTGFGEYAVEKGKILFFEIVPIFNQKAGQFVDTRQPRYRTEFQTKEEALAEYRSEMARRPVRT